VVPPLSDNGSWTMDFLDAKNRELRHRGGYSEAIIPRSDADSTSNIGAG
jgi:hypothetical protein